MSQYTHLFFDLDHTLWDADRNSAEALSELHEFYDLGTYGIQIPDLISTFDAINHVLWLQFETDLITKETLISSRFPLIFKRLGVSEHLVPPPLAKHYEEICFIKPHLVEGSKEILEYLKSANYRLFILTNGGKGQQSKMEHSGIANYFEKVFSTFNTGMKKPDLPLFRYVLAETHAELRKSLMIGDSLHSDIQGAKNCDLDSVFFNRKNAVHEENPTYEIKHLAELKGIV